MYPSIGISVNRRLIPAAGLAVAASFALAPAATAQDWDELAQCESGGDWSTNTGNGYAGGLQFSPSTWSAYGGDQYAANASDATREQQIAVAEQVLAEQGSNAWPGCSGSTSWESGSAETPQNSSESFTGENNARSGVSDPSTEPATTQVNSGSYTVTRGDTLGTIASAHGVTWDAIFAQNTGIINDPHMIYPGQVLTI